MVNIPWFIGFQHVSTIQNCCFIGFRWPIHSICSRLFGLPTSRIHIQAQRADHVTHRFDGRVQVVIGLAPPEVGSWAQKATGDGGKNQCQWIGFVGNIFTGNHRFSHDIWWNIWTFPVRDFLSKTNPFTHVNVINHPTIYPLDPSGNLT